MPNVNGLGKDIKESSFNAESDEDARYLAGLFDGEGCVLAINRQGYGSCQFGVKLNSSSKLMAEAFQDRYGGVVRTKTHRPSQPKEDTDYRIQWAWALTGIDSLVDFAEDLYPHIRTKKPQLQALLMAGQTYGQLVPWSDGSQGGLRLSEKDRHVRELCYKKIRQANSGKWDNLDELGHEVRYA